jgi:hypothetical protein
MLQISSLVLLISFEQQKIILSLQQESHYTTRYSTLVLYTASMYGPVQRPRHICVYF